MNIQILAALLEIINVSVLLESNRVVEVELIPHTFNFRISWIARPLDP